MTATRIPASDRTTRRMPAVIDVASIAAGLMRETDPRHDDTVQLDEGAIGAIESDLDRATIRAARDLERRIRDCGKHADADVVRSLVNRVVNLTGETL